MPPPIRVLHLEDDTRDAELIHDKLEAAGLVCEFAVADSRHSFESALGQSAFDVILCDYNLPDWDGFSALMLARGRQPEVPVIIVSGTLGEDEAVRCLHLGATDYLIKHRLERLPSAVKRALNEAEEYRRRRRAEEALRESEERFRLIAQTIDDVLWMAYVDITRMIYVSPAYERIWRLPLETLYETPKSFMNAIHEDDRDRVAADLEAMKAGLPFDHRCRIVQPDGTIRLIWNRGFPVSDGSGKVSYYVGIARDVTELERLEKQLRQAQKMEAVGLLAGGVAHDFNNLLTVIIGSCDFLLADLVPGDPRRSDVEHIRNAGQRASSLTTQLLAFSRRQIQQPRVTDLNQLITDMSKMVCRLIGEDIVLVLVTQPKLGLVNVDPGQIDQIILNLVVNARDAMPEGGKLIIETADVDLDEEYMRSHRVAGSPGPYVMLAISDGGCGMSEEIQARIFEPFFTTKEQGKGTGLGLSTVYGIVKQCGGFIWVYSEPGRGTTFKIYFPRVEGELVSVAAGETGAIALEGAGTVLVVEDESLVRAIATRGLSERGYNVLEAASGAEALRKAQEYPGEIHLLVTDVVMPGMSGKELASRLETTRPGMKVLFISGYTNHAIIHQGILERNVAFIQKPFSPVDLARKARQVIESEK